MKILIRVVDDEGNTISAATAHDWERAYDELHSLQKSYEQEQRDQEPS